MTHIQALMRERQYNAAMTLMDRIDQLPNKYRLQKGVCAELEDIRQRILDLATDLYHLRQR